MEAGVLFIGSSKVSSISTPTEPHTSKELQNVNQQCSPESLEVENYGYEEIQLHDSNEEMQLHDSYEETQVHGSNETQDHEEETNMSVEDSQSQESEEEQGNDLLQSSLM